MARVKGGYVARRRRKRVLKLAKGYYGSKHALYKTAHEQVMRSLQYSYRDRNVRKRDFRKLWITRINAACRLNDITYSAFINGLKHQNVVLNRKMLAELAVNDQEAFANLVAQAKEGLANPQAKVVVENVFAWPGVGRLCISSIFNRDYPVIQAYILMTGILFVFFNLIFDIVQRIADPRLRIGE